MASFHAAMLLLSWPVLLLAASAHGPARILVESASNPQRRSAPSKFAGIAGPTRFLQKVAKKKTRVGADVYFVAEALDKLKLATSKQQNAAETRYSLEEQRLTAATEQALAPSDRDLLQMTVEATEESKMEEFNAFKAMFNMYYTMKSAFGAAATAPSCELLTCGEHGHCVHDEERNVATCECKPCFEGNGFLCKPASCSPTKTASAQPMALHLDVAPQMADVTISIFQQKHLAVAFRNERDANRGFLMLGEAREADIKWGQLQPFSKDKPVYSPRVIVMPNGRIVVQFRDAEEQGAGYLVGGHVVEASPEKADKQAVMLEPVKFVKGQDQATSLVPLEGSRVVCLYAHPQGKKEAAYGGAIFLQVLKGGALNIIGKYRFADHPVTNIAAVALRPTSFVVAFRDPPHADESGDSYSRELSAVWMSVQDSELVLDPHPIVIEPETKEMGERDVSLVSENLFSYSYFSRSERKTKLAIVRVDPDTHRMEVTDEPKEVMSGDTPFVKSVSLPFQSLAPHTLTYVQKPQKNSVAETCRISPRGKISNCQEIPWANTHVSSVMGARLGDGRLVFIFADSQKDPYYQMLGAPGS